MLKALDIASAGVAVAVFALSIATLAVESSMVKTLKREAYNDVFASGYNGSCWPRLVGVCDKFLLFIPQNFLIGVTWSIVAASSISLFAGVLNFGFAVFNAQATSISAIRRWSWASCIIGCIAALVSASVFIAAFVEEGRSSTWHYSGKQSSYGRYTPESWTCQMKNQFETDSGWEWWGQACKNATAGRWLMLPLALFSIALAATAIMGHRQQLSGNRAAERGERSELKSWRESTVST